ncbi:MAG: putative Ig domain-containing protein, partial [Ignavibacteriales bacterium]|nr:putative Ig domain-containing protein [Ignavibacteriales bacterium]
MQTPISSKTSKIFSEQSITINSSQETIEKNNSTNNTSTGLAYLVNVLPSSYKDKQVYLDLNSNWEGTIYFPAENPQTLIPAWGVLFRVRAGLPGYYCLKIVNEPASPWECFFKFLDFNKSDYYNIPNNTTQDITLGVQVPSYTNNPTTQMQLRIQEEGSFSDTQIRDYYYYLKTDGDKPSSSINPLPIASDINFNVSWNAYDNGEVQSGIKSVDIQYKVYGKDIISKWTDWLTDYSGQNPVKFTEASYGNTYYFQIRARDNVGNTEIFPDNFQTYTNVPYPPITPLTPQNNNTNTPLETTITWEKSEGASRYDLQISQTQDFTSILHEARISETNYTVPSNVLLKNHQYFWRVRAENPGIGSEFSPVWSFTTTEKSNSLSSGQVTPSSGTTTDNFNFSVTYKSPANTNPDNVQLHIVNKSDDAMTASVSNWTNGVQFIKTLNNFTVGSYQYYFTASVNGEQLRYPSSGYLPFSVNQNDVGWDLAVNSLSTSSTYVKPGTSFEATCIVQNNSNTSDKVYYNVVYYFNFFDPNGDLVGNQQIGTISQLNQNQTISITKTFTAPTTLGNCELFFSIIPQVDANVSNNTISKNIVVGDNGVIQQWYIENDDAWIQMDVNNQYYDFNNHRYTITSSNTKRIQIQRNDETSPQSIDLKKYRAYDSQEIVLINENCSSQVASVSFGKINTTVVTYDQTNITTNPGNEITFVANTVSHYFNNSPVIYFSNNGATVADWYKGQEIFNNKKSINYNFKVPTSTTAGTYNFFMGAKLDNNDNEFLRKLTITVIALPPSITSINTNSISADEQLIITGSDFGSSIGSVKFNDVLASSIDSWSGTQIKVKVPSGVQDGNIFVINSNGVSNGVSYTVKISNVAPTISSNPITNGVVGQTYSYNVSATGTPTPAYSLISSPSGMTINSNGLIQWTPSVAGSYDITVLVSNGVSPDASQSFTIVIPVPNTSPNITSIQKIDGVVGQSYNYDVNADGNPTPTYSLTTKPTGMTINSTTGIIQWIPSAAGSFDVTVKASNGVSPDASQSFTIIVIEGPKSPAITSVAITNGILSHLYMYDLNATGNPAPTYSLTTAPTGMTINSTSGVIQWTPSDDGSYDVTVKASNGVSPDASQSFTIVVDPPIQRIVITWINPSYGGTATGGGNYIVGSSVTVTSKANSGYTFNNWELNGNIVSMDTSYQFVMPDTIVNIVANFSLNIYTITASAGDGGSISPSGNVSVNHGSNQSFTITPTTGYSISDV